MIERRGSSPCATGRRSGSRSPRPTWSLVHSTLWLLVVAALFACNGSSPTATRALNLDGRWEGSWTSTAANFGGSATLVAELNQRGATVDAPLIVFVEHLCVSNVTATGDLSGDRLSLTISGPLGDRTELTGTVASDGNRISGTYQMNGGFCEQGAGSGDRGQWTLRRVD